MLYLKLPAIRLHPKKGKLRVAHGVSGDARSLSSSPDRADSLLLPWRSSATFEVGIGCASAGSTACHSRTVVGQHVVLPAQHVGHLRQRKQDLSRSRVPHARLGTAGWSTASCIYVYERWWRVAHRLPLQLEHTRPHFVRGDGLARLYGCHDPNSSSTATGLRLVGQQFDAVIRRACVFLPWSS